MSVKEGFLDIGSNDIIVVENIATSRAERRNRVSTTFWRSIGRCYKNSQQEQPKKKLKKHGIPSLYHALLINPSNYVLP